jgi:hypothetical protein
VKTSPLSDPTRLPSRRSISSACVLRHPPRTTWTWSRHATCSAFVGFAANAPGTTLFHRADAALLLQTRCSRLGPRSRSRILLMQALL